MRNKRSFLLAKTKAVSTWDILIGIALVGIASTAMYIGTSGTITKVKTVEAKTQLNFLYTLEKTYYFEKSRYSSSFSELGYEQNKTVKDGGDALYKIEIVEATDNKFKAIATALKDFDEDGQINIWEIDQDKNIREVTPD